MKNNKLLIKAICLSFLQGVLMGLQFVVMFYGWILYALYQIGLPIVIIVTIINILSFIILIMSNTGDSDNENT